MPPTMTTRSAGRPAAASRRVGTGGRAGRGSGRTRGRFGDQVRGQGNGRNPAVNENAWGDVSRGCTNKEFLACNPKEYDGKGGREAVVGISWEDFTTLTREEFWPSNEMQNLETELCNHVMVGAGHAAYTDRFHKLATLVTHLVTPENKKIERDNNKRTRTGNAFATTANPIRKEYIGHFAKDCRVVPRNVNPINARNLAARAYYECCSTDHVKASCPRLNQAQRLGETIRTKSWLLIGVRVMGTMVTNYMEGHLCIDPNDLGFNYEIEIASEQLIEIDKDLVGYYRRFIENFSKIAKLLTVLTQKSKTCDWGEEQENRFQTLMDKLCNAPVLALPNGPKDFVVGNKMHKAFPLP
nr:reverse transcriptase domain-containing protein [Tanacetum cinerariifolium]